MHEFYFVIILSSIIIFSFKQKPLKSSSILLVAHIASHYNECNFALL